MSDFSALKMQSLGRDDDIPELTSLLLKRTLLISFFIIGFHLVVHPFATYLHPDTTGSLISGQALADEGRAVQPFTWDYIAFHKGKSPLPETLPVVELQEDLRVPTLRYPPGYAWLIATGLKLGFSASQTCLVVFYGVTFLSAFFWQLWAIRCGISLFRSAISLSPLVFFGPATTTDPICFLIAVVLLFLLTKELRTSTVFVACFLMVGANMIRYASILLVPFWFLACLTRPINLKNKIIVGVSCVIVVCVDQLSKASRIAGGDPYDDFSGRFPEAYEIAQALVFAAIGGWVPSVLWLKILLAAFVGCGLLGIALSIKTRELPRWVVDLALLQMSSAIVLVVAQYKYGDDFTQAPLSIARYWRYCAPGLICAYLYGSSFLYRNSVAIRGSAYHIGRVAVPGCFSVVLLLCLVDQATVSRIYHSEMVVGADGFSRNPETHAAQDYLRRLNVDQVLTDHHDTVFGILSLDQRRIRSLYAISGLKVEGQKLIALVLRKSKKWPFPHLSPRGGTAKQRFDDTCDAIEERKIGDVIIFVYRCRESRELDLS